MNEDHYLRVSQVAEEWGVSPKHIRRLAAANLIEAEVTPGGHLRISRSEVERWKSAGGPPPAPQEAEPEEESARARKTPREDLLGEPSQEVRASAEEVVMAEYDLKKLKIHKEKAATEDFFRERKRQQQERETAMRRQAAAAAAARQRRQWLDHWVEQALRTLPSGVPAELRLRVRGVIEEALRPLDPQVGK